MILKEKILTINDQPTRVWSKGSGVKVGFFPGIGGLPKWTEFLDLLSTKFEVVAPSLPGYPGGGRKHLELDNIFDWLLATSDIIKACGLNGADIVASSVSAPLIIDWAATWPSECKIVLVGPFGTYLEEEPIQDIWALRPNELSKKVVNNPKIFQDYVEVIEGEDPTEWKVQQMRGLESSARYLFPFGDTGLVSRLRRVESSVLIIRGEDDQIIPESHLKLYSEGISSPVSCEGVVGAGHLCELESPKEVASLVKHFFSSAS